MSAERVRVSIVGIPPATKRELGMFNMRAQVRASHKRARVCGYCDVCRNINWETRERGKAAILPSANLIMRDWRVLHDISLDFSCNNDDNYY